jgi:DNA-binding CsgD family transcriptional regulator
MPLNFSPVITRSYLLDVLTERERQVARLAATRPDLGYRGIAAEIGVSINTLHNQLASVYSKLGIESRTELAILLTGGSIRGQDIHVHWGY